MRKIPTVFERQYENHKVVGISDTFTSKLTEAAFLFGEATLKWDGSCCAIIGGELYKRYDAKKGKKPPEGAIPCCEADPVTGHHPHWVKCDPSNPSDKWFIEAFDNENYYHKTVLTNAPVKYCRKRLYDGTYEAVGEHFQGNPYGLSEDRLVRHGEVILDCVPRTFEGVKEFLSENYIEGIVFWLNGEPISKIKRSDFGLPWNTKLRMYKNGELVHLADRKTEPMHDLRTETHECVKDTHDKTEPAICDFCRYYNSNIPCGSTPSACKEADKFADEFVNGLKDLHIIEADRKTEPTISKMEQVDKPQTYVINPQEPTNDDKCFECDDFFTCDGQCDEVEDEPPTERSE